jgi:hypothetical protein
MPAKAEAAVEHRDSTRDHHQNYVEEDRDQDA